MTKIEQKTLQWIDNKKNYLFFLVISMLGLLIRLVGFDFISGDMKVYLIPWYEMIKENGGRYCLGVQIGNYNLAYQTIIAFMTYLDYPPEYLYKLLSVIFDYILAFSVALWISDVKQDNLFGFYFNVPYAVILFLPTIFFDSAYWGQCDAIYVSFIVLSLWFLYKEKYIHAFICLGSAFAFKLQTIFILPFFISYYFHKKKFSIFYFFLAVFVFWLSGIGGFYYGRSLLEPFRIYFHQTSDWPQMWINICNFWAIFGNSWEFQIQYYDILSSLSVTLTLAICGIGFYCVLSGRKEIDSPESFLNTACWFFWTCVMFLPAMHERYTYGVDVLLVLLCFVNKRYIPHAALSVTLSTITYMTFLVGLESTVTPCHALLYLTSWLHYTYLVFCKVQTHADEKILL